MRKLRLCLIVPAVLFFAISGSISAQSGSTVSPPADRFPYAFSNFPWWSDTELRTELKKRIPTLRDELKVNSPAEARVRTVLAELLRQKGINAQVQSMEPAANLLSAPRDPDAPAVSIVFGVLAPPQILVEKLVLENPPADAINALTQVQSRLEGKPYSETSLWLERQQMREDLRNLGYLSSAVSIEPGIPTKEGNQYLVSLTATMNLGPRYHVSTVSADAGPLLRGRDLSAYFSLKPGDIATPYAFGKLIGSLRAMYWHAGYADVDFKGAPVLDTVHALASYRLEVIPGPLYHLASVRLENLPTEYRAEAMNLLGIREGDVYDAYAVATLNRKLEQTNSPLKGYDLSYNPAEDKQNHVVNLTLSFYKR